MSNTEISLDTLLGAAILKPALKSLFGQLVVQVSLAIDKHLAQALTAKAPSLSTRLRCSWLDSEEHDLHGGGLDRLLKTHVAVGRRLLARESVVGFATDKGNVKTLNLQVTVIFTPQSYAVVACPQVVSGWAAPHKIPDSSRSPDILHR